VLALQYDSPKRRIGLSRQEFLHRLYQFGTTSIEDWTSIKTLFKTKKMARQTDDSSQASQLVHDYVALSFTGNVVISLPCQLARGKFDVRLISAADESDPSAGSSGEERVRILTMAQLMDRTFLSAMEPAEIDALATDIVYFAILDARVGRKKINSSDVDRCSRAHVEALVQVQFYDCWKHPGQAAGVHAFADGMPVATDFSQSFPWAHIRRGAKSWVAEPADVQGCVKLVRPTPVSWEDVPAADCPVAVLLERLGLQGWKPGRDANDAHLRGTSLMFYSAGNNIIATEGIWNACLTFVSW
jgi:hypothetical protein